ncbi:MULTISPECIES: pantoate--beta-alanine ligase [Nocardiopsis]|uniref:Pantothenate synthetase n=2 Tax=Nocardiopsis alba TaxID=53437 RepID=A0A7K2ITZ6_9ACTN|nr:MULTISPECIES: pantoate--beta-alanine ligase [Nocardiopsis]AFR10035.1 pantoate--beta-alanine ligase [Nocardiopsis alba ATCC BAA-2165]MEC3893820.1 pantoate--beta-alanine ligase [Nocardiopsis sp. LDBS1602]MYR33403.1 pantoate--beta-alanine ligase [Nocardiopsis alba]
MTDATPQRPTTEGPLVARTPAELRRALDGRGRTALVPTMGALHGGHRTLMRLAREKADTVVVSVFVNPLQFGPGEDLDRYPRDLPADLAVCGEEGVDVVFAPEVETMYPAEQMVTVDAGPMGERLEGASRPGHFTGVLTVVTKLFQLVRPDLAVFGEKDAQQIALVRRMVVDLNLPVEIVGAPTLRDPDGLASSSRNVYLDDAERASALSLSRALRAGADAADAGADAVRAAARAVLDEASRATPPVEPDYLALVDPATFAEAPADHRGAAVLAVAARVGATRLIDNVSVTL